MPVAWFLCPYIRIIRPNHPAKYMRGPAINRYIQAVQEAGGKLAWNEVLGNHAVVKVRAPLTILQQISADPDITRMPKDVLDTPLSDLTNAQKIAIRNKIVSLGYNIQEIRDRLGDDIGTRTLRDVLRFTSSRWKPPRYDEATDSLIFDGPDQECRSVEDIDARVPE